MTRARQLVIVLGDQLDANLSALDEFDAARDVIWMAETREEATHVWCHKKRLVFFFAAMRHHRDRLRESGYTVSYHQLEADPAIDAGPNFATLLGNAMATFEPSRIVTTECGDYRVARQIETTAADNDVELKVRPDRHFYAECGEFGDWAEGRKRLTLEDFYRELRVSRDVLMENGKPAGGAWNFDKSNRASFGADGPNALPAQPQFAPDALTEDVTAMVEARFVEHPGHLNSFNLPVTRDQARQSLDDFITNRLPRFGPFQDALWTGVDFAYHSRLSAALNVHLLDPRECVDAAVAAYRRGDAPIASVEGFVRQILGWREFVRGIYWQTMPDYADYNALGATLPVPAAYWDGETDMVCLAEAMRNVIDHAYAHHIQRLMVLGLFAQLAGVDPRAFNAWHMAMYADAVDWVSLPNALGMSQYGDGGAMATKPYCASGNYINKMSNYCKNCQYDHKKASGDNACPITTLYWDFLDRNLDHFADNHRMVFQVKNLHRKRENPELMAAIRSRAEWLKQAVEHGRRF